MSSKIEKEVLALTGVKRDQQQNEQSYLRELGRAISKLSDSDYEKLSKSAEDWFNALLDASEAKKELPWFPDEVKDDPVDEAVSTTRRRRSGGDDDSAKTADANKEPSPDAESWHPVFAAKLKEGHRVELIMATGEVVEGQVLEASEKNIVLLQGTDEEVYRVSKVKEIRFPGNAKGKGSSRTSDSSAAASNGPVVGDTVEFKVGGEEYTGKVIEIDDKNLVVKVDGEEEVFRRAKITGLEVVRRASGGGDRAAAPDAASSRRESKDEPASDTARRRVPRVTADGTSPSLTMRKLIIEDLDLSRDDAWSKVSKALPANAVKEASFNLVYGEIHKLIGLLKEAGRFK
jgi:hypothetical protein